jgi:hypothetical protein
LRYATHSDINALPDRHTDKYTPTQLDSYQHAIDHTGSAVLWTQAHNCLWQ